MDLLYQSMGYGIGVLQLRSFNPSEIFYVLVIYIL